MEHKVIIDFDGKNDWRTIVVKMVNTIEKPNVYTVYTTITNGRKPIYKKTEIKGHEQALKYLIDFRYSGLVNGENCCGFEINHKQTFITKKNPYISKKEYIRRFLWE